MNCRHCGAPIKEGNKFCTQCGTKIEFQSQDSFTDNPNYLSAQDTFTANGASDAYTEPRPAYAIKTDRSILMYVLLTIVTCGIYGFYFVYMLARDVNEICKDDRQNTGGLATYIIFSIITCGFYGLYWEYKIANRLAENSHYYGLHFQENGTTVLLWHLLGVLLCGLGPFIAVNIIIKNTNRLAEEYNRKYNLC